MSSDRNSGHGSFSRRSFLQGTGSAAAAGTLLAGVPTQSHGQEVSQKSPPGIKRYAAGGTEISLQINGKSNSLTVTPQTTLLHAIRESLDLIGTKEVCDRGSCGACTVHVDGRSVNSCMMLALDAVGHKITTIEGLQQDGQLDPVQAAFIEHDACQCGFCIPGFVMRSRSLLNEFPSLSQEEIKNGLCGNICRCAAYIRIFAAVEAASKGGQA